MKSSMRLIPDSRNTSEAGV